MIRVKPPVKKSNYTYHTSNNKNKEKETSGFGNFLCLPKLATELDRVPAGAELHVDFEHLTYIDHACLDLLLGWAPQHASFGGELIIDWNELHARFSADGPKTNVSLSRPERKTNTDAPQDLKA